MFRWTRTLGSQLILLTLLSGCFPAGWHYWPTKKPEVDYKIMADVPQYQQDYIECNAWSRARSNETADIAFETGKGVVTGGLASYLLPTVGVDALVNVGAGAGGGALGNYILSSFTSNHQLHRSTAICLINRGYTLLDHDWWVWAYESRYHAP